MAVATYNTDLATICLMESGDTFEEFTGYTLGDGAVLETDWFIQGSSCASDENNNKTGVGHSVGFDYGSDITFSTGDCFFAWMYYLLPNAIDTYVNGGYRVLIGSTISDFNGWIVGGSDYAPNPYGGWQNVVVDPTHTPDYIAGTPIAYRHFATAYNCILGTLKGRPVSADAMRYGRGDLYIEFGDLANGYGTFLGMSGANDVGTARWGLFQSVAGGYLWKGLLSFGTITNAVDFRDSNVNITIDDTPKTYAAFNKIEINNVSSRVDLTGVSIISVNSSGLAIGYFEVIDNADVNINTCTFTDMYTFIFQALSTINTTTFRRCNQVTQGGATFEKCTFEESPAAVSILASDISLLDNSIFSSDGSNHAIELNSAHAGNSYDIVGMSFTGYASVDGSTGNECIYNNSGGAVTLNILSGDTPTIRNGAGASTTVVAGSVTTAVNVKALDTGLSIENARVLIEVTDGSNFPYQDSVSIIGSGTTATVTHTAHGLSTGDNVVIRGANEDVYNGVYAITVTGVDNYTYTTSETIGTTPATGTITSTFVIIHALTDVLGDVSDTRVFGANQPFTGRVRKSSASPYYKSFPFTGTVNKDTGFSLNVSLVKDE